MIFHRSEQLDRNTIKDWLVRDANGDYIVNKDQVAAYVNSLGYKYDTFGCTRTFTTYDGRQKTIKGGDYGWAIDQTTETEWLYNAILAGTTEVRQPAYAYSGLCRDTNDIGNTYVEIDLTNQRMVFYKDGQLLVDTPVVTGCVRKGHSTPTGCFALDAMRSPAVLKDLDMHHRLHTGCRFPEESESMTQAGVHSMAGRSISQMVLMAV